MSALLRALMGQPSASDKPNLATVTEGTVEFNKLDGRANVDTPIRAALQNGRTYDVSFDTDVTILESTSGAWVNISQYGTWHAMGFARLNATVGQHTEHTAVTLTAYRDRTPQNTDIFNVDVKQARGSVRIYNVSITEA